MENEIRTVLDTAVWAPSGDNSQPWSFSLSGNIVRTHLLPERDNPILNFKLSGTYIAHGALIENIVLAAPLSGLSADVRILPEPADPLCTAEITFTRSAAAADPIAAYIKERHTNRKPYISRALGKEAVDAFRSRVTGMDRTQLFLTEDKGAIKAAGAASAMMEQVALETPALRALFISDILWSEAENATGKQGLYIKTMELPAPARFLMRHLSNPLTARIADSVGFARLARLGNSKLYGSSPLMGLLTIREETPAAYIDAGRALERIWLEATIRGLAFHPVTGILFLARSIEQGTGAGLLPQHFPAIQKASEEIKASFGSTGTIPAMLFRIGYASPASARSARQAAVLKVSI